MNIASWYYTCKTVSNCSSLIGSISVPNSSLELDEYITEENDGKEDGGPVNRVRA